MMTRSPISSKTTSRKAEKGQLLSAIPAEEAVVEGEKDIRKIPPLLSSSQNLY
jgi:hypothetical protein